MRTAILVFIAFVAGFMVHALLADTKSRIAVKNIVTAPLSSGDAANGNRTKMITEISYTDGAFDPASAEVHLTRYVRIVNNSDSLMWLQSEYAPLNTPRGYAKGEQMQVKADREGEFVVTNKLNTAAKVTLKFVR